MSETPSDHSEDQGQPSGQPDTKDHQTGGLEPAPTTPTEDKSDPEAGTGSAHKHSSENPDDPTSAGTGKPGSAGGDITQ
jgi:hypothetical protein